LKSFIFGPRAVLSSLLASSALFGCAGSETGNGGRDERPGQIWFRLCDGDALIDGVHESVDAGGTVYVLEQAIARSNAVRVEFEGGNCADSLGWSCVKEQPALEQEGAWVVDFLHGRVDPQLLMPAGVDFGRVSEIRVKWESPEEPTVEVRGRLQLPDEGEWRPFAVILDIEGLTRFMPAPEALDALTFADDSWVLELDPKRWFETIDIAPCVRAGHIATDDRGVLQLDQAERQCRSVPAGIAMGFRTDGVATQPRGR
jgi:hypothetical protein